MHCSSPARIAWAASITALSPEPQTLLTVSAGIGPRETGMDRRLAARRLADTPLKHVAHDDFFDRAVLDAGAAHGLADHEGTEPGGGQCGEPAQILADRGCDRRRG